jgi:hypothetical protein
MLSREQLKSLTPAFMVLLLAISAAVVLSVTLARAPAMLIQEQTPP